MRRAVLAMVFFVACSCLPSPPSCAWAGFPAEEDEKRLWHRSEEEERILDSSGYIYRSKELEAYLDAVARKLVPPEQFEWVAVSVAIIMNPRLNAFSFANGRVYVSSGLLAAMENEAQLATLLGHELSHVTGRHMLRELRDAKSKMAISGILGALTGNVILPFGQLGALASTKGFSRERETEADAEGLRRMVQAGYDPAEAPKLFAILLREVREEKIDEPFFFASHPKLKERLENWENLLKTTYAGTRGGVKESDRFMRAIAPLLLDNAELDLKAGRIATARRAIARYLALAEENARGLYLLGETYRQGGEKQGPAAAKECYLKAVALDPAYPDPYRGLGFAASRLNDRELARKSFERYLELSPRAPDHGYIEEMLKRMP
ncbi:MAG TPA: M48 family metalloprotease [Geobacteraceae bacterium]